MNELYIYTTPREASVKVTLDHGGDVLTGVLTHANGRDDAHLVKIPLGTPQQGVTLEVMAPEYALFNGRGILMPSNVGEAKLLFDDVRLTAMPSIPPPEPTEPPPTQPGPPTPQDPFSVILWVYERGTFNLATTQGCGQFVEACAWVLYNYTSPMWGHVRKFPGQNQWNGHAVDAIHCLGGMNEGIWDIITNSEAPGAAPAFNYAGPADPAIWYSGDQANPPNRVIKLMLG